MIDVESEIKEINQLQLEAMKNCDTRVYFHGWAFDRQELDIIHRYLHLLESEKEKEYIDAFDNHGNPLRDCDR